MVHSKRVLVVGIDGATWDLIEPWAVRGELPTFRSLMENGVWGELESTIPSWTIPAWSSLSTGLNPGKLGFVIFMVKDGYRFTPYFFKCGQEKKRNIWDIVSKEGKKVCIANLPNIQSAYSVNGCMVVGWLYINRDAMTYPPGLKGELDKICGGYIVDIMTADMTKGEIVDSPVTDGDYIRKSGEVLGKHHNCFKFLLDKKDWDFGFVVYAEPDRIQHRFWSDKKILLDTYKKLDTNLKELLEKAGQDTNIFLVSDHGFGPNRRIFYINEWLIKEGYLRLNEFKPHVSSRLFIYASKLNVISLIRMVFAHLPKKIQDRFKGKSGFLKYDDLDIDWKNTRAFAYSVCGDIYLNVKGREPDGCVDPRDYKATCDEIIGKLKDLKDPITGEDIPARVFQRDEIYHTGTGDMSRAKCCYLPDLVIHVDGRLSEVSPNVGHGHIFERGSGGNHLLNGIFLAYGPDIKNTGEKLDGLKIYDIAPTILHTFGIPIPQDTDGRVLKEIFKDDSNLAERPVKYQNTFEKLRLKTKIRKLRRKGGL